METRPPTFARILIAVGFAISCFALAVFLWITFGGPIPLKPEGYRFTVPFDEATQLAQESDVRISGVSVGKVKRIELSDEGLAEATIELESDYAPIPDDTRATLRQKTLLGETYVELTPGSEEGTPLEEDGALPAAQVADSVQLDEIFRAFDPETRAAFQVWMQSQAEAFRGRGDDFSAAIAALEPLADEADQTLRVLDSQRLAVQRLVRDGGEVFAALSERQGQLSGLIRNSKTVFETTAARDAELADIFSVFPTFLRETRATLSRLETFARDTDPVVTQLRPAVRELSPTFIALGELAPDLGAFFLGLDRAIGGARDGFEALRDLLDDDLPPLLQRIDPYMQQFNSILEGVELYKREIAAFLGNVTASFNYASGTFPDGTFGRAFRTEAPLSPEVLSAYGNRLETNRTNPYLKPGAYDPGAFRFFETAQCVGGITTSLPDRASTINNPDFYTRVAEPDENLADPVVLAAVIERAGVFFDRIQEFAMAGEPSTSTVPAPPCLQQGLYDSIGINPEQTRYLHVREQP
jgi:phospholipid/cholesterol/gamma-HCH transport system substrate-binding protein